VVPATRAPPPGTSPSPALPPPLLVNITKAKEEARAGSTSLGVGVLVSISVGAAAFVGLVSVSGRSCRPRRTAVRCIIATLARELLRQSPPPTGRGLTRRFRLAPGRDLPTCLSNYAEADSLKSRLCVSLASHGRGSVHSDSSADPLLYARGRLSSCCTATQHSDQRRGKRAKAEVAEEEGKGRGGRGCAISEGS
jgi:hypothetical protein